MADAKSNGCVAPFSDEEIKVLRMEFDGRDRTVGFQLTAERYDRFLATIAADRKRIEELEHTRLGRVCPTCAKQTVDPMKWCDRLAAEQVADQAATIERLREELGFKYGKQCPCGLTVWVIPDECQGGSS